jgi:hypothetical protein
MNLGKVKCCEHFADLCADPDIDPIDVCTPTVALQHHLRQ